MAGIYLHIPFCKQACHYCDFHFSTKQDYKAEMVEALNKEVYLQKAYLEDELIETIYFGGGTPSLLSDKELGYLLNSIHTNFNVKAKEVTLEANPDDLRAETLSQLRHLGINRLSIGIQSLDDRILKFLNRSHTSEEAITCFDLSRKSGFNNLSLDLIYAIPGQDSASWKKIVERAIDLSPEHISAYSLTIEKKTVFGNWQRKGTLLVESDEIAAEQMEILIDLLGSAGYDHYEISNFCKPGLHSKHNSSYWLQKKYLGIGPSAHSYDGRSRQFNVRNNPFYIQSIEQGKVPFKLEILSRANKINEYLLTTLRTNWGCDVEHLVNEFDYDLMKERSETLKVFFANRLLEKKDRFLLLTCKGKLLADKIASDLFMAD
jgi:oxygen-independent coproporphyrinogen III oxidase